MPLITGCEDDPGALTIDDCQTILGAVREVLLVKSASYSGLDRTDATEIQTLINAGNAFYLPKVRGEYTDPENAMQDGFGDDSEKLANRTHTVNFEHNVIRQNRDFWNTIRTGYYLGFRAGSPNNPVMYWSTVPVYLVAAPPVPAAQTDQLVFKIMAKWEDINIPEILIYPGALTPAA